MPPIAAFGFFCLGSALALLDVESGFGRWFGRSLPCVAAIASLFALLDFVLNRTDTHTHISPITPSALFLLSLVAMIARPESGLGALVASESSGGTLTRRLFPAAIIVPLALAWLRRKGQISRLLSGLGRLGPTDRIHDMLLTGLTVWTGFVTERRDLLRRQEEELFASLALIFPL